MTDQTITDAINSRGEHVYSVTTRSAHGTIITYPKAVTEKYGHAFQVYVTCDCEGAGMHAFPVASFDEGVERIGSVCEQMRQYHQTRRAEMATPRKRVRVGR